MSMDPAEQRDERVMSLVDEASKIPLRERDSFLLAACQTDPNLYHEVSEIVKWEEQMGSFLLRPLVEFIDLDALEQVFKPGQTVEGRFEIVRRLGDGGMGVVYEAYDNTRKRRIAIKCPKPGYDELLPKELSALDVRHPNVCLVNDIHKTKTDLGEVRFLTMEFLDGETLAHKLESGKLEEAKARLIASQLCSGLAEAHRSNILHRDLKPANVILCTNDDGNPRAVITDFGLAVEVSEVSELEGGTPSYMAPELWRGGKASQASDVFALGVMLYEMVTGSKPFPALNKENVIFPPPVAPSKVVKNLPRRWDEAILPCLKENPDERCSAEDVLSALERKAFYRKPAVLVAMAACLALIALATSLIIGMFKPAPYTLVILPPTASGDLALQGQSILTDAAKHIQQIQSGKPTVSVIPPDKAKAKNVATPEQAAKAFGATHVLQVKLRPDADGISVEGAMIDLHTMAHVQDYSGHFAMKDLADYLPGGLAGTVSWGLHLPRKPQPENVAPAAASAYNSGMEYLQREPHDFKNAIPEFQKAAQLDPHSPLPLAGLAEAKARAYKSAEEKQFEDEAQEYLAKAEALNPDSPRVRMASGLLHLLFQKNYPLALLDYQRVEEIDPNNVDAFLNSGYAYENLWNPNKARNEYQQARLLEPKNYKTWQYLGELDFKQGDYNHAIQMYDEALQLKPGDMDLQGDLAAAYIALGMDQHADEVLKQMPGEPTALILNNLGAQWAFRKKDVQAIQYYQRAIHQNSQNPVFWLNLGDAQRRLQNLTKARQSYKTGLGLTSNHANQSNAVMWAYHAYFLARLGNKKEARKEIDEALEASESNNDVMLCAVNTYEALGDRDQAIDWAGKVSPQTLKNIILRHPDLAGLQQNSRFKVLVAQSQ